MLHPMDPNSAISAHAVFPQSGHICPEKRPFFPKMSTFSKLEPTQNEEPLIGVQNIKLKPMEILIKCTSNHVILMNRYDLVDL